MKKKIRDFWFRRPCKRCEESFSPVSKGNRICPKCIKPLGGGQGNPNRLKIEKIPFNYYKCLGCGELFRLKTTMLKHDCAGDLKIGSEK